MFIKIYLVLSFVCDAIILFFTRDGNVNGWDIVFPILIYIAAFVGLFFLHVLFCFVLSLFVDKTKVRKKPNKFYKFLLNRTVELLFDILRIEVVTSGIEKVPVDQKFLLVSNHRSNFDPLVCVLKMMDYNLSFISKPENFKLPIVGQFMNINCFLPIDRENARNAMKTIRKATEYIKDDIVSMGVYPEGTRSKTGELLDFKDGVFYIAKKARCPVVVSTVKNTENAFKNVILKRTKVYLDIIEVLCPEELENMTTHEVSDKVWNMMYEHLK